MHKKFYAGGFIFHPDSEQILLQQITSDSQTSSPWSLFGTSFSDQEKSEEAFKDIDAIITPTTPLTAVKLGEMDTYPFFGELMDKLNEPASVAGVPAISIPAGLDSEGLPVGMQIIGNYFAESTIMNLAYQFEQETNFFDMREQLLKQYPD